MGHELLGGWPQWRQGNPVELQSGPHICHAQTLSDTATWTFLVPWMAFRASESPWDVPDVRQPDGLYLARQALGWLGHRQPWLAFGQQASLLHVSRLDLQLRRRASGFGP